MSCEQIESEISREQIKRIESLCGKLFNRMGHDTKESPWTGNSEAEDVARDLHRLLGEQLQIKPRTNQDDVADFHRAMGQAIEPAPVTFPGQRVVRLRGSLVAEEFVEFLESLFDKRSSLFWRPIFTLLLACIALIVRRATIRVRLPELVDSIVDMKYVLEGTNLAFGVDGNPVWDEVHDANMRKLFGPRSPEGKVLKPPGWTPPDVARVLREQGWEG